LGFSIGADSYALDGPVPVDRYRPEPDVAWYGHEAIELVGPSSRSIEIVQKEYDSSARLSRLRTRADARAAAAKEGFVRAELETTALPVGRWVKIDRVELRFERALDEHDASAAYGSSLQLRCDPSGPAVELAHGSQGELAIAFRAPGAAELVVGLREWSGGEGSGYYETRYVYVDPTSRCPSRGRDGGDGPPP
jgi:hypothetical protein